MWKLIQILITIWLSTILYRNDNVINFLRTFFQESQIPSKKYSGLTIFYKQRSEKLSLKKLKSEIYTKPQNLDF